MPIVQISILEGREPVAVKNCMEEVALALHRTLNAPLESIRILVTEMPATHWAVGGRARADIDAERAARQEQA